MRIVFKLILCTQDQNVTKLAIRKHESARKLKLWQKMCIRDRSLVLQGPQMSEAVQAHQKAAPVDQAEQVGLVVRLAAEAELAALAQLALQAEQVALVEQVALAATLLPDQAELVVQAESAAAPVLAELVEMFLLFLRPIAEAAGYSYLFRPWLPLPIGEIFLPQRRPTLLALLKGC